MNHRFASARTWCSVFVRLLVLVALAACDSPTQEEVQIFSTIRSAYSITYGFTDDSLVVADGDTLVELELDGTPRGTGRSSR